MGRVRWKLALPFALTGAFWTPVSSEGPAGVQPTAVSGSFLGVFVCWRAKRGTSPATGPDFWEATRKPEPRAPRANTNERWPSDRTPLVAAGPRMESSTASGVRKPPASTRPRNLAHHDAELRPGRDRDVAAVAPPALREEREGPRRGPGREDRRQHGRVRLDLSLIHISEPTRPY